LLETNCIINETLHTFTGTGRDIWKELAGEILELPPLRPVRSLPSMISSSVPDEILAFFLGGAAAPAVVFVIALGFNAWPFRFLISGIVFDGNMSAILERN
jgi:hypothetical protein